MATEFTERAPRRRRMPFWPLKSRRRRRTLLSVDHAVFAETRCAAGQVHLAGLCVAEGLWMYETTPCDVLDIAELRRRVQAGDLIWWRGEVVPEAELLAACACGAGYLLRKDPRVPPEMPGGAEHVWPTTARVQALLAGKVERWRADEAELSRRIAAGADAESARRLREERAQTRAARERYERVLAWIPTAPELSNALVMATSSLEWDDQRGAWSRGRWVWMALADALDALAGIASILRPKKRRR